MNIRVYGLIKEVLVQTISLGKDQANPENTYLFHCVYCSQSICQIQGRVDKVFPGLEPTNDVIVAYKCPQCHRTYTFQTHNYKYKNITRVVLTNMNGIMNTFHCYICRTPLLQFRGSQIYKIPEFKPELVPFNMECPKNDCKKRYSFVDIV